VNKDIESISSLYDFSLDGYLLYAYVGTTSELLTILCY